MNWPNFLQTFFVKRQMLNFNISKSIFIDLPPQGKNYQLIDFQSFNFSTKILTFPTILTFHHSSACGLRPDNSIEIPFCKKSIFEAKKSKFHHFLFH